MSSRPAAAAAPPPPPADVVQHLVDRAAHFNMFSMPDARGPNAAIRSGAASSAVIGVAVREALHRFSISTRPPTADAPLASSSLVGERAATLTHRWLIAPEDFVASPNREPPPTRLDTTVSQRFVMLDGTCTFADGAGGFRSFGTGRTYPTVVGGEPRLLAMTVGTIIEGFGSFQGREEGTFVHCGTLEPERGFTGNVLLRVVDRDETFRTERALPPLDPRPHPEPDVAYILFRGQAVADDPVTPRIGGDGRQIGLTVEQGIRLLDLDFAAGRGSGLKSTAVVGPSIGRITAHVTFNPTAAPGTALQPIPFTSFDEFVFFDREGAPAGGFTGDSTEGRVFQMQLGGQGAIRFGGIGRVLGGSGPFQGISGLMTDNSLVVFTPHVSASLYLLRIHDPAGRFRAAATRR